MVVEAEAAVAAVPVGEVAAVMVVGPAVAEAMVGLRTLPRHTLRDDSRLAAPADQRHQGPSLVGEGVGLAL